MFLLRFVFALAVCVSLVSVGHGQTLTAHNFVLGQVAQLDLESAAPNSVVVWLYSLSGQGNGACVAGPSLCLDILDPVTIADVGVASPQGIARYPVYLPPSLPLVDLHLQAVTVDYSAGAAIAISNAVSVSLETVAAYDDDFSAATLDSAWQIRNSTLAQVSVQADELVIEPLAGGPSNIWFNGSEGVLVYREVTGDFTVTSSVRVSDSVDPSLPPSPAFQLGGLLVRDPSGSAAGGGGLNSAHIAFGSGPNNNPIGVEHKTTLASVSSFVILPTTQTAGDLRIRRTGSIIELFYRELGQAAFQLIATYPHPEFPPTIQVGMMSYSFTVPPSVVTRFDSISFTSP